MAQRSMCEVRSRRICAVRGVTLFVWFLGTLAGCGDGPVEPKPIDPATLYWRLGFNQRAINLSTPAPHDTFRLVVTPQRLDGTPLAGLGTPRFASDDSNSVRVTADGIVTAFRATPFARITVSVTDPAMNLTHQDSVFVTVSSTLPPPVLDRLSLEPVPADSAKGTLFADEFYFPRANLSARAFDAEGNELQGLAVWIESSDADIASYDNTSRTMQTYRTGPVEFYATTVANGVERTDTLAYVVGVPLSATVRVRAQPAPGGGAPSYRFDPATITVGTGGYIRWEHSPASLPLYDVTFEDPADVAEDLVLCANFGLCFGSGDIAPFGDTTSNLLSNLVTRHFPATGAYRYQSSVLGISGTIIVVEENGAAVSRDGVRSGAERQP